VDHLLLGALGAQRDRPPEDLSRRPKLGALARLSAGLLSATLLLATLPLGGCGGGDDENASSSGLPSAGGAGSLVYALPVLPATLDPLTARGRAAQTVSRQVHEPLVARLSGPYGATAVQPGLALLAEPSPDNAVWTLTLRRDVRFQDGTPFNAAAVLANSRRWTTVPAARGLLPGLFAVDAPRPDQVRFLLDRPDPALPRRLSSARLGIVSPLALAPQGGEGSSFRATATGSGTGPFEPGALSAARIELGRNAGWWGSPLGLGPALDGIAFLATPAPGRRLGLLESGQAQVADPLGATELAAAAQNPLLDTLGGPRTGIGLEGSVRGLDSARAVPVLSRVWLTDISG
jgi:peptide/nickel transport system substrate-binding protein